MYLNNKKKIIVSLLPLTFLIMFVVAFGIYKTFQISISLPSNEGYTLDNYFQIFKDADFLNSYLYSLKTAFISSLFCIIIGVFLAVYLWCSNRKVVTRVLSIIPIIVPHIMVALLVIIICSQTGVISRVFFYLKIIEKPSQFVELVNDSKGIGIIIAYVYKGFPFVGLVILGILNSVNYKEIQIAKALKANHYQLFTKIIMPKIIIPCIYLFVMLFIYSFTSYEIPSLLGASTIKALPVYSYYHYSNIMINSKEYAMALNIVIIIISLIFTIVMYWIVKNLQRKLNE